MINLGPAFASDSTNCHNTRAVMTVFAVLLGQRLSESAVWLALVSLDMMRSGLASIGER